MFDNTFDNNYFCDDFISRKKDCVHQWETTEFSVFKDDKGIPLAKKKRCVTCGDTIEFGTYPNNSVKVVYMPPRPQFIPPDVNFFKPHYQHFKPKH